MTDDFAERFLLLCRQRSLRSAEIARRLNVDPSTPWMWMHGHHAPKDRALVVGELFDGMTLGEFYSLDLNELRASDGEADAS